MQINLSYDNVLWNPYLFIVCYVALTQTIASADRESLLLYRWKLLSWYFTIYLLLPGYQIYYSALICSVLFVHLSLAAPQSNQSPMSLTSDASSPRSYVSPRISTPQTNAGPLKPLLSTQPAISQTKVGWTFIQGIQLGEIHSWLLGRLLSPGQTNDWLVWT